MWLGAYSWIWSLISMSFPSSCKESVDLGPILYLPSWEIQVSDPAPLLSSDIGALVRAARSGFSVSVSEKPRTRSCFSSLSADFSSFFSSFVAVLSSFGFFSMGLLLS